jgi:hypothetical protein
MPEVGRRRNHAVAGLALVVAGALTWVATGQGFVRIDGPGFTEGLASKLGLGDRTGVDYLLSQDRRVVLHVAALGLVVVGLLLLVTRLRFLGLLWRLGGLCCVGLTGVFAYAGWRFVSDPASGIKDNGSAGSALFRGGVDLAHGLGLVHVKPGPGLCLVAAASIVALLGVLTPAIRRTRVTPTSAPDTTG